MSLDTSTLTTTAIPNIAARTVEQAATQLYAAKKAAYEAFWAALGLAYFFYDDEVGTSLVQSAEAIALDTAMSQADPSTGWPSVYFSTIEERLNDRIESDYADQPTALLAIGP